MKKCYNFGNAGVWSIKTSDIAYKTATKTQILDKLGLYITLLENAALIQVTEQKNAIELKVI